MKGHKLLTNNFSICLLALLLLTIAVSKNSSAQDTEINKAISNYRKGEIIIQAKPGAKVTVEQMNHEFWFGCAIPNSLARGMSENDFAQFEKKFLENFNAAVTENALKWAVMERRKDNVDYRTVDSILSWTEKNNIPLRGHNLFWGIFRSPNTGAQYVQQWVAELDDDELRQRIKERAKNITKRYKGRFAEYDLNNEMIHGNFYEDRLGPEITKLMAQWALEGDPDAKLWLNDYDILIKDSPLGIGLPEYMAQIRLLLKQNVPIAGIGVQAHSHLETFDREYLIEALDSLATFNLPIRITEFNLPGMRSEFKNSQLTPEQEVSKAKEIVDYYKICFAHPAVDGIIMWGFWEGANWIPSSSLYKRDWTPTPAADAYKNLVFNEWWTNTTGATNNNGEFTTDAFFGKYRIIVDGVSKEVDLSKEKGKVILEFN